MNPKPRDLFEGTNAVTEAQQLAITEQAIEAEKRAQERALMIKHNVIKEITYISKCGKFTANNLEDLITKMSQATQYKELMETLPEYLKSTGKDIDYRDILEYVANHYKLEPRNNGY